MLLLRSDGVLAQKHAKFKRLDEQTSEHADDDSSPLLIERTLERPAHYGSFRNPNGLELKITEEKNYKSPFLPEFSFEYEMGDPELFPDLGVKKPDSRGKPNKKGPMADRSDKGSSCPETKLSMLSLKDAERSKPDKVKGQPADSSDKGSNRPESKLGMLNRESSTKSSSKCEEDVVVVVFSSLQRKPQGLSSESPRASFTKVIYDAISLEVLSELSKVSRKAV